MNQEISLLVFIDVQKGKAQEQLDAFNTLAPKVREEKGCIQYELARVADTDNKFVLIEKWETEAALATHEISAHMVKADANNQHFRAKPAEVIKLTNPIE